MNRGLGAGTPFRLGVPNLLLPSPKTETFSFLRASVSLNYPYNFLLNRASEIFWPNRSASEKLAESQTIVGY